MKQREFQPRRMDIGAFIESGELLEARTPVTDWARICAGLPEGVNPESLQPVHWQAQGRVVPQRVGAPQWWLDLQVDATLPYECQRCLNPVLQDVALDISIRFVADEAAAAALDAETEEDVLAVSRQFNLLELIEDELIMGEPILPRHEICPVDVQAWLGAGEAPEASPGARHDDGAADAGSGTDRPNPFAVLASLKKKSSEPDVS